MCRNVVRYCLYSSLLILGISCSTVVVASSEAHYQTTLHILNYSNLPKTARFCVFDSATAKGFTQYFKKQSVDYDVHLASVDTLQSSHCQVVYFTKTPAQEQVKLIQSLSTPLLSMSENNEVCEIGSAFCLYRKDKSVSVKINMEMLGRSKVKVDPRVIYMWIKRSGE